MPCRPAICSHSLGRAWVHSLASKLDAAAAHGFTIELFFEDLQLLAASLPNSNSDSASVSTSIPALTSPSAPPPTSSSPSPSPSALLSAAHLIRSECDSRGLSILSLQPFAHFEGLVDRAAHAQRLVEARLWFELAHVLGTDLIAIPSSFLPAEETSGEMGAIVADLRELADLGAEEGIRFAYEALCWGTHVDTWEASWGVVERVDRGNFGVCLDTFNIAGRVYADPAAEGGRNVDAEGEMRRSLERLVRTVDVRRVMYVQVVDAERLEGPLVEGHELYDPRQPARMSWSRNCRLFYGEEERGAYLPIKAILKAIIVDLGFEGYISAEVFSRDLVDPRPDVPEELAWRAAVSWQKIVHDFGLAGDARSAAGSLPKPTVDTVVRAQL